MRRQAQACAVAFAQGFQALQQVQHVVGASDEATLPVGRCPAPEAAGLVQHGQQRQADAGTYSRLDQTTRQRRIVGVGQAIAVMVHVMEFADRRVARLEHLDVERSGDVAQLIRRQHAGESVHQLAPAPEAVVFSARVKATEFRQPGKCALEGVRVQVGHARQQRASSDRHAGRRGAGGPHGAQAAMFVPLQQHVACPSSRQQGMLCEQRTGMAHRLAPDGVWMRP